MLMGLLLDVRVPIIRPSMTWISLEWNISVQNALFLSMNCDSLE